MFNRIEGAGIRNNFFAKFGNLGESCSAKFQNTLGDITFFLTVCQRYLSLSYKTLLDLNRRYLDFLKKNFLRLVQLVFYSIYGLCILNVGILL